MKSAKPEAMDEAGAALDRHVKKILNWHFTPETGTPYWLDWAKKAGFDPRREVRSASDLLRFPHFDGEVLRHEPHDRFVPRPYRGRPFCVFETGGTTGMPKQRISWEDHLLDYDEFSKTLDIASFPLGANWLMLGPTGPRRLRLAVEHLANRRGGSCYHVDLDPRWVKRLIGAGDLAGVAAYKAHVVDQAVTLLKHREIACLFATPLLLEALGERISVPGAGVRGVFCGGTTMTPQTVRFLCEEVLENKARLVPTYGNTLMGLACSLPPAPELRYSVTYFAPQPRAVLRLVDPDHTARTVDYGQWGRVELTTLTREFFMPRFLERDEAMRRPPCERYPWDGVADVRPYTRPGERIIEGVY